MGLPHFALAPKWGSTSTRHRSGRGPLRPDTKVGVPHFHWTPKWACPTSTTCAGSVWRTQKETHGATGSVWSLAFPWKQGIAKVLLRLDTKVGVPHFDQTPKWACPTSLWCSFFGCVYLNGRWNTRRSTRGNKRRRRIPSAVQAGGLFYCALPQMRQTAAIKDPN